MALQEHQSRSAATGGVEKPMLLPHQEDSSEDGELLPPNIRNEHDALRADDRPDIRNKPNGQENNEDFELLEPERKKSKQNCHEDAGGDMSNTSSTQFTGKESRDLFTHENRCPRDEEPLPMETSEPTGLGNEDWSGFLRHGTRLRGLVGDTFHLMLRACSTKGSAGAETIDDSGSSLPSDMFASKSAELARKKTIECMILQRKLEELQANISTLSTANSALREAAASSSERMERTVEALRIAGSNAANARADADAAEAYASSLASQLKTLRNAIDETKRSSEALYDEHLSISEASRSLETKIVQRETEYIRAKHEIHRHQEARDMEWKRSRKAAAEIEQLQLDQEQKEIELQAVKRKVDELTALEKARNERSERLEKELREAKSMVADAATSTEETETTVSLLKETIEQLKSENQKLYTNAESIQDRARKEHERLQNSLEKVEKEARALRLQSGSHEHEMKELQSEKQSSDKQVSQLKTRIMDLERKLKDTASIVSPSSAVKIGATKLAMNRSMQQFRIPPLTPLREKSPSAKGANTSNVRVTCCICYNPASGLMKSCQCGRKMCGKRAHSACITSAISGLGSTASSSSIILCQRN